MTRQEQELWNAFVASLPPGYAPSWEFAYGGDDATQLYAVPTTQAQRDLWAQGQFFPADPDRELTAQGLYTGQVEGAQQLDPNAIPEAMRQDYDLWQQRLQVGQAGEDSWSPFGDQFFSALAALGLATGGAAAFGGFAAPAAEAGVAEGLAFGMPSAGPETLAATDALGPILATGGGGGVPGAGLVAPIGSLAPTIPAAGATVPAAAAAGGGVMGSFGAWAPLIGSLISGGSSLIGGLLAGDAAKDAAATQAGAAGDANQLLREIYAQNRQDLLPYLAAGYQSLPQLAGMAGTPLTYGEYTTNTPLNPANYTFQPGAYGFTAPNQPLNPADYAFTPPSGQDVLNQDPGYQFRVQQGMKALESGAAARGGLVSGGALKASQRFGQDLASQEYQNAYNRLLGQNQLAYQRGYTQNQDIYNRALSENQMGYERGLAANQLNYARDTAYNADVYSRGRDQYLTNLGTQAGLRNMQWNELAALAGLGKGATGAQVELAQNLGTNMANNITSAGAANAAGQMGASNALLSGLTGVGNAAGQYLNYSLLQQLLGQRNPQAMAGLNALPFG